MLILPIAASILITSSLVVLSSNSWILVWVALELNTLSFCSILITNSVQQKNITEASINYFIIQSTASAIIILYLSTPESIGGARFLFMAGTTAILINLASAPFHSWFLEIVPNVSINASVLLITWQNLAPIYILIFIINTAVLVSILVSGILGSVIQIVNNNLIEIIALSSIFNLSWIILASIISSQSLFVFIATYWAILILVIIIFINHNTLENTINWPNGINPWLVMVSLAGLAGLPPTLGFYANIQVVLQALNISINEIVTMLLVISATNFYIYLRIVSPSVIYSPSQSQNSNENPLNNVTNLLILNFLPIIVIVL